MTRREREELLGALAALLTLAVGGAVVAALAGDTVVPVAAVLAMAFAKGRLIILDFMEFRDSRSLLRAALIAWPCVLLTAAFARSLAVAVF
ncbi:cytochrome C oxidase subunit IV family protein [Rhizobium sp. 18065]|uniref:cytochrome C oxidase subunit IV family protein n=1 Tax=Rhizobium sp. 18065 TaxID=2681411 RepID=UPI0013584DE5|nr:cytochrome C oxidase subunit IV family protein [Rhizobium sp. 18065]